MTLTIRPLNADDIDELRIIDQAAHGEAWSPRLFRDELEQSNRRHLVAEAADGSLLGHAAAWIDGNVGRITNVALRESAQGSGFGANLFVRLLRDVLADGVPTSLRLEVRSDNRVAQRFYLRFGFAPVGFERNFYSSGDQRDALVMTVDDPYSPSWQTRLDFCESAAA
jgi:ribosomal-protein-alanine N-acetyltransferase